MATTRSTAPILAVVLLLLPVLYVGSYLALVVPEGVWKQTVTGAIIWGGNYRVANGIAQKTFWPLEQIDRKLLRPGAWVYQLDEAVLGPPIPPSDPLE